MKLMVQIRTTMAEGEKFIRGLAEQGYVPVRIQNYVHFIFNGETSLHYAVTFTEDDECAFIGVRPQ